MKTNINTINWEEINLSQTEEGYLADSVVRRIQESGPFEQPDDVNHISLTKLRESMNKQTKSFTKTEVLLQPVLVNQEIEIAIFKPEKNVSQKVILFIHGGGFIGGNFYSYQNQLEYLAELSGAQIVALNYKLAPENPFPDGVSDVRYIYRWMLESTNEYGWDPNEIIFIGDSAGANLGLLATFTYDEVEFSKIINIYGALDFEVGSGKKYDWNLDLYGINKDHRELLENKFFKFNYTMNFAKEVYLKDPGDGDKQLLNIDIGSKKLDILYIEAEFDYFRFSNRYFLEKIHHESKISVITYLGMDHGFFERLGSCDEALDVLHRISKYIKSL